MRLVFLRIKRAGAAACMANNLNNARIDRLAVIVLNKMYPTARRTKHRDWPAISRNRILANNGHKVIYLRGCGGALKARSKQELWLGLCWRGQKRGEERR